MTLFKGLVIVGLIFVYFLMFILRWFEYENKQINEFLKNDDSVSILANNDEQ